MAEKSTGIEIGPRSYELNPEAELREYLAKPLDDEPLDWEPRLRANIKKRLANQQERGYINAVRNSWTALDAKKEQIIAALVAYELDHIKEVEPRRGFSQTLILRLGVAARDIEGKIRAVSSERIDKLPLSYIAETFLNAPKSIRIKDDVFRAAKLVFERGEQKDENERAARQQILDRLVGVVVELGLVETLNSQRPSEEMVEYFMDRLSKENPEFLHRVFSQISEAVARAEEYRGLSPTDPRASEDYAARGARHEIFRRAEVYLDLLKKYPVVGTELNRYVDGKRQREVEERRLAEERKVADEEAARAREAELKEEQDTKRAIEAEEYRKSRKEQADAVADEWIKTYEAAVVDGSLFSAREIVSTLSRQEKSIWFEPESEWKIVALPDGSKVKLSHINIPNIVGYADREKQQSAMQIQDRLTLSLGAAAKELLQSRAEEIVAEIESKILIDQKPTNRDEITQRAADVTRYISSLDSLVAYFGAKGDHPMLAPLKSLKEKMLAENDDLANQSKEAEAEEERTEKLLSIEQVKTEYLLEQIEAKINYLQNLYAASADFMLSPINSRGHDTDSQSVATVMTGMRQGQSLRMRQELRLKVNALEDGIDFYAGEDLKSILERIEMVDYVAPHEIAHMVDHEFFGGDKIFESTNAPSEVLASELTYADNTKLKSSLHHNLGETCVDSIGVKLALGYGTSDPTLESQKDRLTKIVRGFIVTSRVVMGHAKENEDEDFTLAYPFILLRNMGVADGLRKLAGTHGSNEMLAQLDSVQAEIQLAIDNLEHKLTPEQQKRYAKMCSDIFDNVQAHDLKAG